MDHKQLWWPTSSNIKGTVLEVCQPWSVLLDFHPALPSSAAAVEAFMSLLLIQSHLGTNHHHQCLNARAIMYTHAGADVLQCIWVMISVVIKSLQ